MRPKALADHEIGEPVSIKVSYIEGMWWGKNYAIAVFFGVRINEAMQLKHNCAIGGLGVFEPGDAVSMAGNCRDNVVVAIAVDISIIIFTVIIDRSSFFSPLSRPF